MPNNKVFTVDGEVIEALPGMKFIVEITVGEKKKKLMCHLSGKITVNYIRVVPGDKVQVEISPYDKTVGKIIYRYT